MRRGIRDGFGLAVTMAGAVISSPFWLQVVFSILAAVLLWNLVGQISRIRGAKQGRLLHGLFAIPIVMGLGWVVYTQYETHLSVQTEGELMAPSGPPGLYPEIYVGGSKGRLTWKESSGQVLIGYEDAGVIVERTNGKLFLTAKILGEDGNLIAYVYRNKWYVNPSQILDKNYTKNSLEVVDKRGIVVLQVKLTSDRMNIQGEWWDESGTGTRLVENPYNEEGIIMRLHKGITESQPFVKAMFRYPSNDHQGELAETK
jgi:hypothetical protein